MKLLLTCELGRLAKWLRILGFDTAYATGEPHSRIIIQSLREERTIVTRNTRLASAGRTKTVLLTSEHLKDQIPELLNALKLKPNSDMMFSRCTICNTALSTLPKETAQTHVPAYVVATQEVFHRCATCGRIYWAGTHWGNVAQALAEIAKECRGRSREE